MAYIGVSPSNGVRRVHTYTATASQTTFSGAGAEGTSLSYKDSNFVDVYQNGVKLGDADYTATSGTSIVLGTGATASDLVVIVVFDVFSVADTVSKADGGTFDGNVTMGGTLDVTGNGTVGGTLGITGAVTANAGVNIDNITIDGTEIDLSSGNLTVDVAGAILLDADVGNVQIHDAGTEIGRFANSSSDFVIKSAISDKDMIFKGNDGGSEITALTFDMSDGGAATFAKGITLTNGNVALANGNGIDFSATGGPTSGSGSTELLDDYEEGTFTPILQNTGGVPPSAYDIQVGFYTKVGRLVHCAIMISPNGLGSVGTSNVVLIVGLPYDSLSSTNHDTAISISHAVNLNISSGTNLGGFLPANSTNIRLSRYDSSDGTTDFTFGELSSDGQIKVAIQYNTG